MKITRILSAALAVFFAAALFAGCAKKTGTEAPDGMKLASDPDVAGYSLFVPEDWDVDMQTKSTRAYCPGSDKSFIMVMTGDLVHADSTVDDWWEEGLSELEALYADFTLVSRGKTVLGGVEADKFVYTGTFDGTAFKYTQTAAIKSGAIYIVTYGAEADKWEAHSGEADSMLAAFRFGK